jgi:hypothetical protein
LHEQVPPISTPPKIMSCWHDPNGFSVQSSSVRQPPPVLSVHEFGVLGVSQVTGSVRCKIPPSQRSKPDGTGGSVKPCSAGTMLAQTGAPVSPLLLSPLLLSPAVVAAVSPCESLAEPVAPVSLALPGPVLPAVVPALVVGAVPVSLPLPLPLPLSSPEPFSVGEQASRPRAANRE